MLEQLHAQRYGLNREVTYAFTVDAEFTRQLLKYWVPSGLSTRPYNDVKVFGIPLAARHAADYNTGRAYFFEHFFGSWNHLFASFLLTCTAA
jgi:hypothetical protein